MRWLIAVVLLFGCGGTGGGSDAATEDSGPALDAGPRPDGGPLASGPWVMGYYPGYQRDLLPPDEIDFTSITHLAVGRAAPRAGGTLDTTFDITAAEGPPFARDLADRAHAAGRRAILMLGGAGEHDGWVAAASDASRASFVDAILATMDDLHFDGVDVDWEPIDPADEADFAALVHELRMRRPEMTITIPIGWVNANAPDVSPMWASVAADADQLNVMSYGMAGPWDGWDSWHGSALQGSGAATPSSVDTSIAAYLAVGVPASRLGVGIGFYGECWTGVSGPGESTAGATIVADDNTMSYAHIAEAYFDALADPGAPYRYDAAADAAYLTFAAPHGPESCTFVSYESPESIAAKGAYVRSQSLGGTIIWTINEGHVASAPLGAREPALDAVRAAFLE